MSAVFAVRSPRVARFLPIESPNFQYRDGRYFDSPPAGGLGRLKPPVRIVHKIGLPQTGVAAHSCFRSQSWQHLSGPDILLLDLSPCLYGCFPALAALASLSTCSTVTITPGSSSGSTVQWTKR